MISLDTNIISYHLTSHEKFGPMATRLMKEIESGAYKAIASMIVFSEVMTYPARMKVDKLFALYREILLNYPNLEFICVDSNIAEKAAQIRGSYPELKMFDALVLATALQQKAKVLVTEDKQLYSIKLPLSILSLDNFFRKFT